MNMDNRDKSTGVSSEMMELDDDDENDEECGGKGCCCAAARACKWLGGVACASLAPAIAAFGCVSVFAVVVESVKEAAAGGGSGAASPLAAAWASVLGCAYLAAAAAWAASFARCVRLRPTRPLCGGSGIGCCSARGPSGRYYPASGAESESGAEYGDVEAGAARRRERKEALEALRAAGRRYCRLCVAEKPPRTHHCSDCGACVPRMDHHCVWINTCVGWHNHKFFVLMLGWAVASYSLCAAALAPFAVATFSGDAGASQFFLGGSDGTRVVSVVALVMCCSAFAPLMLFVFHMWLVSHNLTTLECMSAKNWTAAVHTNPYDLGTRRNFNIIFGGGAGGRGACGFLRRIPRWILPVWSSLGDGVHWEVKAGAESD
ncbi:Palmitoyltransferase ZDHHC2 [Pelomyxa schiedti]|nr:Palmitoyltransferase ZDHHC2 [Pelomyxa schiedti]